MWRSGQLHIGYAALAAAMPTGKDGGKKRVFALFHDHFATSDFFLPAGGGGPFAAFLPPKVIIASAAAQAIIPSPVRPATRGTLRFGRAGGIDLTAARRG